MSELNEMIRELENSIKANSSESVYRFINDNDLLPFIDEVKKLIDANKSFKAVNEMQLLEIDALQAKLEKAKSAMKSVVGFEPFNSVEPRIISETLKQLEDV